MLDSINVNTFHFLKKIGSVQNSQHVNHYQFLESKNARCGFEPRIKKNIWQKSYPIGKSNNMSIVKYIRYI